MASGSVELAWEAVRVWPTNVFDKFGIIYIYIYMKKSVGPSAFHLFSSQP